MILFYAFIFQLYIRKLSQLKRETFTNPPLIMNLVRFHAY